MKHLYSFPIKGQIVNSLGFMAQENMSLNLHPNLVFHFIQCKTYAEFLVIRKQAVGWLSFAQRSTI